MRVVGLTGGIGSGKSTVADMMRARGARVIDADAIVRELQGAGTPLLEAIVEAFGTEVLREDGELDREALGAVVFRDEEARRRLNALVHPAVGAEMARRLEAARREGADLVVLDVPLLLEGRRPGSPAGPYDCVVVVWVPESVQVERTVERDGCDREEALRRVRAQMALDEKRERADHVIDNSGTREETERQVEALVQRLRERA